jgi:hypothetical protein
MKHSFYVILSFTLALQTGFVCNLNFYLIIEELHKYIVNILIGYSFIKHKFSSTFSLFIIFLQQYVLCVDCVHAETIRARSDI